MRFETARFHDPRGRDGRSVGAGMAAGQLRAGRWALHGGSHTATGWTSRWLRQTRCSESAARIARAPQAVAGPELASTFSGSAAPTHD